MLQNQLFDASTRSRSARILAQDMAAKNKMDIWVISEDSVIINCRGYVVINIVTALIIVLGAMAVPFAVKQRITGVDPFQITSFSWVVAAFIIILAKSRYVSQWPWHDFLRGRVVCNSVSDVHDVTGVDSQMIIWYLLYAEHDNILRTKGPFNGMFGQVSSTEGNSIQEIGAIKSMHNALFGRKGQEIGGFAIDVPVDLSTMLASGFIIFKVLNDKGEHLICVDVRKGTEAAVYERIQKETFLSCMNIDKELNQAAAEIKLHGGEYTGVLTDGSKILKLSKNEFRWSKMLGLYIRDSKFG
jgi:hypothetical protein